MIEIRHLRSLVAIAECGRIATAAEQVHLSKSALSYQIRAIESHYGIDIFERSRQGIIRYTRSGERLLILAREILSRINKAEQDLVQLQEGAHGKIRIAFECHTSFNWLTPVLEEFQQTWPFVEIALVRGFHSHPMALLNQGKADAIIGSQLIESKEFATIPIFKYETVMIAPKSHHLCERPFVEASDLKNETLITYPIPPQRIDLFRDVLLVENVAAKRRTSESTDSILQLVKNLKGITALPVWGLKDDIEYYNLNTKKIGPTGLWNNLYAVTPLRLASHDYFQDFIDIIRKQFSAKSNDVHPI